MKLRNLLWMLLPGAALMLASCESDDEPRNPACFSAEVPADTRTTLDKDVFYWTSGDKIFVKHGSAYVPSDNAVAGTTPGANFYLSGQYTWNASSYPVVYTGNGAGTSPTSVTINSAQTQDDANDATHIGIDGDCGNAMANYTNVSSYAFLLDHRASYLRISPRHDLSGVTNVVLKSIKVEVPAAGNDYLCGTYTFSENTLSLANETNSAPGKAVTLTVGNWTVPSTSEANADVTTLDRVRGYIVIQPGSHSLKFTYTVRVDDEAQDREITRGFLPTRDYTPGKYTEVKQILQ